VSISHDFTFSGQLQEGKAVASIKVGLDEETTVKYAFVGQNETGMPELMGEKTEVMGANFEFWKVDENSVDDALRESIKTLCSSVAAALNRYYAFGHVFSEEI
jgi:hypothetical protein